MPDGYLRFDLISLLNGTDDRHPRADLLTSFVRRHGRARLLGTSTERELGANVLYLFMRLWVSFY